MLLGSSQHLRLHEVLELLHKCGHVVGEISVD